MGQIKMLLEKITAILCQHETFKQKKKSYTSIFNKLNTWLDINIWCITDWNVTILWTNSQLMFPMCCVIPRGEVH